RHLRDTLRRNLIIWELPHRAGARIICKNVKDGPLGAEIAGAQLPVGNQRLNARRLTETQAFVIAEEESLVLANRSAEGPSELVALKGRPRTHGIEKVSRVQRAVAQELKRGAMEAVGSAVGDQ